MSLNRRILLPTLCALLVLSTFSPVAQADLTVTVDQATGYSITVEGASSPTAPETTTIQPFRHGYLIDWTAPANASKDEIAGYNVYCAPGPSTGGDIEVFQMSGRRTALYDAPGAGTYVYFVTAVFEGAGSPEGIPGQPVSTADTNYPHCNVASVYFRDPYYDAHLACLFPLP